MPDPGPGDYAAIPSFARFFAVKLAICFFYAEAGFQYPVSMPSAC